MPTHVVVDTRDGYVFYRDSYNRPFNLSIAGMFAAGRNMEMENPHTFKVYRLIEQETN